MKDNGILHLKSAPFKPSKNGLAERFIGIFKFSMRAMTMSTNDINSKVNTFLIRYRNTPHAITGESPSKLFLGRNLRTRLDLLKPDTKQAVSNLQIKLEISLNVIIPPNSSLSQNRLMSQECKIMKGP